jgi:hypothetical protein
LTVPEVLLRFEGRLSELEAGLVQARAHSVVTAGSTAILVALFLMLGFYAFRQQVSFWWPSLSIPLAVASARRHGANRQVQYRTSRLRQFYRRAVERVKGNWTGNGPDGEEYSDSSHVYTSDLNVFGQGSLFELLCTARTGNGQRGLAEYLASPPSLEETVLRQEAVQELKNQIALREQVALLGKTEVADSKWETFAEWLDSPSFPFPRALQAAALATSFVVAAIILCGLIGLIPWIKVAAWAILPIAFHSIAGLRFRNRVNRMLVWLPPVSVETQVLKDGMHLLETTPFESVKLRQLADRARNSSKALRKLERLLNALNERNNEWLYGPSLLLLVGKQLCMAIENWRVEHGAALRTWLDVWADFEALNAFANYAYENPEHTFPEFSADQARFEAEALGHPLLPRESCVGNDVRLNREHRFYVVSGSNMSGKSTLLRAIGLNAVLAFAGAPVRARSLRVSRLSVCASLSVVDSLLIGKSKFMAEVDRLRRTLEMEVEGSPVLFLIDEILSGTNSRDRRVAAEAVVRTLVDRGAIGALSTHDLALSEIAALEELHGANAHMGSKDGGGPMDFDYILKPGVTTESNAMAIARMAGVRV